MSRKEPARLHNNSPETFDLGDDRWRKKFVEALLALSDRKEPEQGKDPGAYANRIYYGLGLYGVETASRACFGKSANELTLSEAAILAGLIRSPKSPHAAGRQPHGPGRARSGPRQDGRAQDDYPGKGPSAARAEPILPRSCFRARKITPWTRSCATWLILLPKDIIDRGGLKIYTTIDPRLQMIAERPWNPNWPNSRPRKTGLIPSVSADDWTRRPTPKTDRVSLCPRCAGGDRQ